MNPFASVRAIALDMDETIIDFSASRAAGLEAVLEHAAKAGHPLDRRAFLERHRALAAAEDAAYIERGVWMQVPERFRTLCREFNVPSDGFADALAEVYAETRFANLHQYPETREALTRLNARFPLFLVTNGPPASQHREIEVTDVARYFTKTFVCEDHKLRKPDPRMFELVRAAAGVAPEEMLMVGDFWEADIETPRRLGWRTVWVVRDGQRRRAAESGRADAVVRSVGDLPGLLAAPRDAR